MMIKRVMKCSLLAACAVVSFSAMAGNVDANMAQAAANTFVKQKFAALPGKLMAPATADIKLTHTVASSVSGNAYYVFNITGGGWVIIAGDDRAKQVLAYSDHGTMDMNNLSAPAKYYLDHYKTQIEKVQNFKGKFSTKKTTQRSLVVEPLMKSDWGQNVPFDRQCPQQYGSYCPVGCAGLAMAQILNYWEYPKEVPNGLPSYYNEYTYSSVPALDPTTFDWDNILDKYTILINGTSLSWAEGVNDTNKAEVAKLCRYAAQSCKMNFRSSGGSGSNVEKQKDGFLLMGYDTNMKLVGIQAVETRHTWNTWDYTDEEWLALIDAQLEAGHPIPYSTEGGIDGHAYVIDGVDADGLYHCNWGFYGADDGYFAFGAFNPVIQGQTLDLNDGFLYMVIDLYPYEGYISPNAPAGTVVTRGDVDGNGIVDMDDLSALINYLLNESSPINTAGAASCSNADDTTAVDMDDLSALINFLLTNLW